MRGSALPERKSNRLGFWFTGTESAANWDFCARIRRLLAIVSHSKSVLIAEFYKYPRPGGNSGSLVQVIFWRKGYRAICVQSLDHFTKEKAAR